VPNVALGTDIIVGFPTETDAEFEETYQAFKELEYSVAFIFAYSQRQGTPAMRWKDDIPEKVKQERLQRLLQLHETYAAKERQALMGETMEVLVEAQSPRNPDLLRGRTRCWKNVLFPGDPSMVGQLVPVTVHSFNHSTMIGEVASVTAAL
jgi:tRNA-2-methylthio-N6-dimethylallyladenosine synthase